jgi:hypothetical protein
VPNKFEIKKNNAHSGTTVTSIPIISPVEKTLSQSLPARKGGMHLKYLN